MLNVLVATCRGDAASTACAVNEKFPGTIGVPLITPVMLKLKPDGSAKEPAASDHASGAIPPVAVKVWL